MLQIIKGTGHSLAQTDFIGNVKAAEIDSNAPLGIVAGMLVQKEQTTGDVTKIDTYINATETYGLVGFAITNQVEGDAIASGKIGVLALDGGTVIGTDQYTGTVTSADIGKAVVADGSGTTAKGKVKVVTWANADTSRIVGTVYEAPRTVYVGFTAVTVLPIKLGTGGATVAIS
jgi:hypothetical protein